MTEAEITATCLIAGVYSLYAAKWGKAFDKTLAIGMIIAALGAIFS